MLSTELSRRKAVLRLLTGWPAARLLARQQTPEQPTFSTDVKVVNVFATVRDAKGQIVRDLTKDDFMLSEGDRPQIIRYFARQTDLPLTTRSPG